MKPRPVDEQDRAIRRLNYRCPKCGSDFITENLEKNFRWNSTGTGFYTEQQEQYVSSKQVVQRLKCLQCGHEFSIVSHL